MKILKKMIILGLILVSFLSINLVFAENENNMVKITIDNISFEENSLLKVLDDSNQEIVRYNRFENKNVQGLSVKNTRIYDLNNNLIMTAVINFDQLNTQLYLLNKENQKGLINIQTKAGFGKIINAIKVDYFNKNFTLKDDTKAGMTGSVTIVKELLLDNKTVMKSTRKMAVTGSSGGDILVDKDFLTNNKEEAGIWALIFLNLTELGK